MNNAKMVGKNDRSRCGCCTNDTKPRERRQKKRRERQALRKFLSTI